MKILGWSKTGLANILKSIDAFADKIKKAEAAAIKAAKEFEKLKKENHEWAISLITRGKMLPASTFETPVKGAGMARGGATLAGPPEESINNVTAAMAAQANMVQNLSDVFENMFLNIDKGFKGMIESLIDGIKKLVIELAAKAAVLMLIRTLFPMSFGVGATTQLQGMFGSKLFSGNIGAGKAIGGIGSQNISLSGGFKLAGKDSYLMVERRANLLIGNT